MPNRKTEKYEVFWGYRTLPGGPLKKQVSLSGGKRQSLATEGAGFLWGSGIPREAEEAVASVLTEEVPLCHLQAAWGLPGACTAPW